MSGHVLNCTGSCTETHSYTKAVDVVLCGKQLDHWDCVLYWIHKFILGIIAHFNYWY